jgi:hypothetical protein
LPTDVTYPLHHPRNAEAPSTDLVSEYLFSS